MLKVLKFDTKIQNVFFSSDYHAGHKKEFVWRARGFNSVDEHDKFLVDKTNEIVSENSILFHLGDLNLNTSEEQFEDFISRIKCQNIYCLWGNHVSPMAKIYKREVEKFFVEQISNDSTNHAIFIDKPEIYPFRYKNIIFAGRHVEISVNKQHIVLNHYPLSIFNGIGHNSWALTGHSHNGFEGSRANNPKNKILDVGWDGFKKPLDFDEVSAIMATKQYVKIDAHH